MAWHFNETNGQYVTIGDNAALTLPDADFTIGGWVYLDDNIGTKYQYFLSWGDPSADPSFNLYFREHGIATDGDKLTVRFNNSDPVMLSTSAPGENTTAWMYVCIYRSSDTIYLEIDNVAEGNVAAGVGKFPIDVADSIYLGAREDLDEDRCLGGSLAEWAKWDRALSAAERAGLLRFSPKFYPGLKWHCDMRRRYRERVVPLTVTNNNSTVVAHPPIIYPVAPMIVTAPAVAVGVAPTGVFYGPLVGPFGGPI